MGAFPEKGYTYQDFESFFCRWLLLQAYGFTCVHTRKNKAFGLSLIVYEPQGGGCNVPTLASVLSSRNVGTLKANVVFQQCGGHGVPTVCVVFQRCSNGVPTVFERSSHSLPKVFSHVFPRSFHDDMLV